METKSYLGELYIHIWDCQERFFNSDIMWQSKIFFCSKYSFIIHIAHYLNILLYTCVYNLQSTIYRLQSLEEMLETGEQTNKQ